MSNFAAITVTKFVEVDKDGAEVETDYGLRISDEYDSAYRLFAKEDVVGRTAMEILALARTMGDSANSILDSAKDNNRTIEILGTPWSLEELEPQTVAP